MWFGTKFLFWGLSGIVFSFDFSYAGQGKKRPSDCVSLDWTLEDHGKSIYADIIHKRKIPLLSKNEVRPGVLARTFDEAQAVMEEIAPTPQVWEEVNHRIMEEGIEKLIYFLEVMSGLYVNIKDHSEFAQRRVFVLRRPVMVSQDVDVWLRQLQSKRNAKNWFDPYVDEYLENFIFVYQKIWIKYFINKNNSGKTLKEIFQQRGLMQEIQEALNQLKEFSEKYESVMIRRGMDIPIFVSRKRVLPYHLQKELEGKAE